MGLTAIVSNGAVGISPTSAIGMGIGSLFASLTLVFLLGYLNLFDAAEREDDQQRSIIVAVILPLLAVFVAIVLFQALQVLQAA